MSWLSALGRALAHRHAPAAVLLLGAWLAALGSQWPQARAPVATRDGMNRSDLLLQHGWQLDRWLASLPVQLWWALAVAVGVAWLAQLRRGDRQRGDLGRWLPTGLSAVAALAFGLAVLADTVTPEPIWLDVAAPADAVATTPPQPIAAWHREAGQLQTLPGTWFGLCRSLPDGLRCRVRGPGLDSQGDLRPDHALYDGGWQWQWVAKVARAPALLGVAPGQLPNDTTVTGAGVVASTGPLALVTGPASSFALVAPQWAGQPGTVMAAGGWSARLLLVDPLAGWLPWAWLVAVVSALLALLVASPPWRAPRSVAAWLMTGLALAAPADWHSLLWAQPLTVDVPSAQWLGLLRVTTQRAVAGPLWPHDPVAWLMLASVLGLAALLQARACGPRWAAWMTLALVLALLVGGSHWGLTVSGLWT